jgi:hypothetical protein
MERRGYFSSPLFIGGHMAADGAPKVMQDPAHAHKTIGPAAPEAMAPPKAPQIKTDAFNVAWNQVKRPFGRKLK